jgi:hypothetical protein
MLHRIALRHGRAMLLRAGRLHALDAGNLILEIQQNSDIYGVHGWGRLRLDGAPRDLHVDECCNPLISIIIQMLCAVEKLRLGRKGQLKFWGAGTQGHTRPLVNAEPLPSRCIPSDLINRLKQVLIEPNVSDCSLVSFDPGILPRLPGQDAPEFVLMDLCHDSQHLGDLLATVVAT